MIFLTWICKRFSSYKYQFCSKTQLFPHHSQQEFVTPFYVWFWLHCCTAEAAGNFQWQNGRNSENKWEKKACLDLSRLSLRKRKKKKKNNQKCRLHLALHQHWLGTFLIIKFMVFTVLKSEHEICLTSLMGFGIRKICKWLKIFPVVMSSSICIAFLLQTRKFLHDE